MQLRSAFRTFTLRLRQGIDAFAEASFRQSIAPAGHEDTARGEFMTADIIRRDRRNGHSETERNQPWRHT